MKTTSPGITLRTLTLAEKIVDAVKSGQTMTRLEYFIYKIAEHLYTKAPSKAYVEVRPDLDTEKVTCIFSADSRELPGIVNDLAEHVRHITSRHRETAINPMNISITQDADKTPVRIFSRDYMKIIENKLLEYGIPLCKEQDEEGYLNLDIARLSEPGIDADKIDAHIFPGSQILRAIDVHAKAPKKTRFSLLDIIGEGDKRGYDVTATLERIQRCLAGMYKLTMPV